MYQPPHPRSTMAGQAWVGNDAARWSCPMPQVSPGRADPQANRSEGSLDHAGVGLMRNRMVRPAQFGGQMGELFEPERVEDRDELCAGVGGMRHRVVPPTSLDGQMLNDVFPAAEDNMDEFSCVGGMRNRVAPSTSLDGRMTNDVFPAVEDNMDEFSCAMNSTSYFTNLLVNDVHESQDLPPPSQATNDHVRLAAKVSQGRSKNFRDEEDKLLVSAWLNVGMDPIKGSDQPRGTYWQRVHKYFHDNKTFESDRTHVSLMNRWGTIQHDVNVFCGCVSRIEDSNRSGWSIDDKIANACAMFKAEDSKHNNFSFMHCWKILKDKPKWMERRRAVDKTKKASNKKQKTMSNSSPASAPTVGAGDVENTERASERPDGKKKEKQKLRQRSTVEAVDYLMAKMKEADIEKDLKKDERWNKALALQEEKIKLDREKFEFQRQLEEERILSLDLSTMSSNQQKFFEGRQNEILARRYGS